MTALYPIHVLPATDLYAYGLDAADMPHGLIVTNAPLFHEFIKTLVGAKTAEVSEAVALKDEINAHYTNLSSKYKEVEKEYWKLTVELREAQKTNQKLLAAYERDTGRRWVYEEDK